MTVFGSLGRIPSLAMRRLQRARRKARAAEIRRIQDEMADPEDQYEWVSSPSLHSELMKAMEPGWGKDAEDKRWAK